MKHDTNPSGLIGCCICSVLTVCLAVLEGSGGAPLLPLAAAMFLQPLLLLAVAGVQFRIAAGGIRALCAAKPDRHTSCVLIFLLALILCALGSGTCAPLCAALAWTACAWLDRAQARLTAQIPGAQQLPPQDTAWSWAAIAAAVCACAVWAIMGARTGAVLMRALCMLLAGALCPFGLIGLLTARRALRALPDADVQTLRALGAAEQALICPEGLLTEPPQLAEVCPAGMPDEAFLSLAASVMQPFGTPEASALEKAAQAEGVPLLPAEAYEQTPDGFSAVIDGRRYYAGSPEQLRRRGIFAPRTDTQQLSGKTALCFGMEGGRYLGLAAMRAGLCPGAQEAVRAIAAQRIEPVLAAQAQPLFVRQLAARVGAQTEEPSAPGAASDRTVRLTAGEARVQAQEKPLTVSVRTLSDAAELFRVCRSAEKQRRALRAAASVCAVCLTGLAAGLFAPALDAGGSPLVCALLGIAFLLVFVAAAAAGARPQAKDVQDEPEPQTPAPVAEPAGQAAQPPCTLTIRMDALPALPGKAALEQALLDVPGVRSAEADYESGIILVTGNAEKETLLRAIAEAADT